MAHETVTRPADGQAAATVLCAQQWRKCNSAWQGRGQSTVSGRIKMKGFLGDLKDLKFQEDKNRLIVLF
jgi:hypothetical protein